MKKCGYCGGLNEESSKFCTNCGSKQFFYICPNCSNEYQGKFCPSCGTKHDAVAKICPECGTKYFSNSCHNCGYNESRKTGFGTSRTYSSNNRFFAMDNRNIRLGMIFSIIGIFLGLFPLSIAGLVLALRERKNPDLDRKSQGQVTTIIVLSVIGLVFVVLQVIIYGGMAIIGVLGNR